MLSENGDNKHVRAPDHSTVSIQNGGKTLPCGFSLERRCRVDGRKRYEKDKCGRKLKTEQNSSVFVLKTD